VRENLTHEEATRLVAEFEARGHKQTYFVERQLSRNEVEGLLMISGGVEVISRESSVNLKPDLPWRGIMKGG
jgi:hypothetical protein